LLQQLLSNEIVLLNDDETIRIDFLDEQMEIFSDIVAKRSMSGKRGGLAKAKQMLSKRKANANILREDKEKIRVDNRFIPPTIEEIKLRMVERKLSLFTAEAFHAHYTTNGWMVGKNKMKDWDSALTTWNEKAKQYESSAGNSRRDNKRTNKLWN
jgi:hypothetical protein